MNTTAPNGLDRAHLALDMVDEMPASGLGYVPPAEFEHAHYKALNREPQPA